MGAVGHALFAHSDDMQYIYIYILINVLVGHDHCTGHCSGLMLGHLVFKTSVCQRLVQAKHVSRLSGPGGSKE